MPLPDCVDILPSEIHGKGLFAIKDIPAGTNLGLTHWTDTHCYEENMYEEEYIKRTPLGGFYNSSDTPNCVKLKKEIEVDRDFGIFDYITEWFLITTRDIKEGEEITVKYTFYNV